MKFRAYLLFIGFFVNPANCQSFLDLLYRYGREALTAVVLPQTQSRSVNRNFNVNSNLQRQFSPNEQFFCDTRDKRSKFVPNSVHKLKPGDIDIIVNF